MQWTQATGHDKTNVFLEEDFFVHLNNNNLSTFTFLNPTCCGVGSESMHPSGLISDGEAYIKKHYDALRASKYWEETLFMITFVWKMENGPWKCSSTNISFRTRVAGLEITSPLSSPLGQMTLPTLR
ncbi:MAG TPA: alkaline phosphatase family protein [Chlamydiales bacterium]|nr:alkaline phosphatase family protein [Chlamydiales bacterium]